MAISSGNSKLPGIPNVSLLPVVTCVPGIPCSKCGQCYALPLVKRYPSVRKSWTENTELARNDPDRYWAMIRSYVKKHGPEYFRFHVGGDILSQDYLERMKALCAGFKSTRFSMLH